jgi:ribosomal protein L32
MSQEPKRRHSIARKGKRRAGIKLTISKSNICKNCQNTYVPHTICANCGFYKGKQFLKSLSESKAQRLRQFRSNNLKRKIPIMKTSQDPRHKKRQSVVQELFGIEFHDQKIGPTAQKIIAQKTLIDIQIQKAAPDFPVSKINKIDLAILRLAVYELIVDKKAPQNVIIDEAVELAKEFGNETSPAFVNGVLGHILSYANVTKIQ